LTAIGRTPYGGRPSVLMDEVWNFPHMNDLVRRTDSAAVDLLVLNYNGRRLLADCLPSIVRAAVASRHRCRVTVIDNDSSDDSVALVKREFPDVVVLESPNRGLCSFNGAVAASDAPVAILLNNDIKLRADSIEPLAAPLKHDGPSADDRCFMTAPLCWLFDGVTYEGMKTSVRWRWGLVQATSLFAGHERAIHGPGFTASSGAVLAVDREKFLELGGFDPIYLPGRLEDFDFCYRGYQAGYHARYVPEAVAYHQGCGTFEAAFGRAGCDRLALRNTLLFQWKNLRHPAHVARQLAGLPVRFFRDVLRAPWLEPSERFVFVRALHEACLRWRESQMTSEGRGGDLNTDREWAFFRQFHPQAILR